APCRSGAALPTTPGPIAETTTSNPCARAQASADATPTHSTSPSKHAPAAIATSRNPRDFSSRTASDSETDSAPPGTCTYATRRPASAAQTGASWLWSEQHTTGTPPSVSASSPDSSACTHAACAGVYGSFITCAPSTAANPTPRVRFACSTSNPPDPSDSARAWSFTSTSSSTATGPVSRGYAMQGSPSTSRRTSPSCRSRIAVTRPRLSPSGIDQRKRDVDHRVDVGDRDVLVGGVDVRHPVRGVAPR